MSSQEKPIGIVSKVLLLMLAIANDALEIFSVLLAATVIGLAAQAIMEPIDFLVDAAVTTYFAMKVGFGWPTIIQFVADILESFGIPSRTISVGIGIYLVNHPDSALSKAAQVAATVEGGGEESLEAVGKDVQEIGEQSLKQGAETELQTGEKEIGGRNQGGRGEQELDKSKEDLDKEAAEKRRLELETGEPKTAFEEMDEPFSETPVDPQQSEEDEDNEDEGDYEKAA